MSNCRDGVKKLKRAGKCAKAFSIKDLAAACKVSYGCVHYRILTGAIPSPTHTVGLVGRMKFYNAEESNQLKSFLLESDDE